MDYQHEYDKRGCASIGNSAERKFIGASIKRDYKAWKANTYENAVLGIDVWIKKNQIKKSVDVKARKKSSAKDSDFNDDWTWVEYRNADGHPGWLLKKADYLAFEKEKYFIVVDRISLFNLCEKLIDKNKEKALRASEAKYIFYTRRDKELCTQIKTSDILSIKRKAIWDIS
jgi:hypothetical protein